MPTLLPPETGLDRLASAVGYHAAVLRCRIDTWVARRMIRSASRKTIAAHRLINKALEIAPWLDAEEAERRRRLQERNL
jgi:hypothetical protein